MPSPSTGAPSLPTRDGVGPSCVALPPGPWLTVLDFLAERFAAIGRQEWQARLLRGDVLDAQGHPLPADQVYRARERLYYYRSLPQEPRIPFDEVVLYQDELLVVADKPHFLPVLPAGRYVQETLLVRLKRRLGLDTLAPMHRLDRETAGLVLFTVRPDTRDRYQALFRDRLIAKHYEAIAPHRPDLPLPAVHRSRIVPGAAFMTMREEAGEPNSETAIDCQAVNGAWARFGLSPRTGVKHQLRVHMAALGRPIRHDLIYPVLQPEAAADGLGAYPPALQLLARTVAFTDPVTGQARRFDSARTLEF
ncbi:MAG: pseudouridine synthase [Rubrivivax sp.]|nr:MAG: pseudouridine synthase [Rubrivivax sp.]